MPKQDQLAGPVIAIYLGGYWRPFEWGKPTGCWHDDFGSYEGRRYAWGWVCVAIWPSART